MVYMTYIMYCGKLNLALETVNTQRQCVVELIPCVMTTCNSKQAECTLNVCICACS